MATSKPQVVTKNGKELLEPMCPSSQCINSYLSLCIIGIAESEIPIDVDKVMVPVKTDLLRVNPSFSSIVVRKNGKQWWKHVEVRFEDHIFIPTFPPGLSPESYTACFDQYLSKLRLEKLPETRPLWELHIIKYPTQTAAGMLVFKMHHAIGDGFSIMGAIFSVLKRADDSSLPLTFPSASIKTEEMKKENICFSSFRLISACFNTITDTVTGMMHTTLFRDGRSPIKSGMRFVESLPMHTMRITFSLDEIRKLKSKIDASVNDVVVGMIFYGVSLYTKLVDQKYAKSSKTALVLLNTRMLVGYRSLEEMLKKNMWGNKFSFIQIQLPTCSNEDQIDLKEFISHAKKIIKRKRNSMAVILNGMLLSLMGRLRGSEAMSKYIHSVMRSTSFTISNLVGPMEKMAIADHPISNIYFTVTGSPQSLIFSVMSYMGKLTIVISVEKGFVDSELLASSINEAFRKILDENLEVN